jgi:hypothetical protein
MPAIWQRFAPNLTPVIDRLHLPETLLLRDTLYLLQGISGKYIQFAPTEDPDQNQLVYKEDSVSFFIFCAGGNLSLASSSDT